MTADRVTSNNNEDSNQLKLRKDNPAKQMKQT